MKPYELTKPQLAALPALSGAELLAQHERRVWRRWNDELSVIASPRECVDPNRAYALAPKDKMGRRMAYAQAGSPDFFIIGRNANAMLNLRLKFS